MAIIDFEKDFGYLMPFLDKVAAAANSLADPAARAELSQLMADEKRRWTRARELLSGGSARGPAQTSASGQKSEDPSSRLAPRFTVGSLRPQK